MFTIRMVVGSPFGRAVTAACVEKGVPYRIQALTPGQHKSPDYLAKHPFGRMPLVEDGDFALYETQAIIRYLDAIGPGPALTPSDPKAAARMNQVMGIVDWYFFSREGAVPLVFNRVVAPRIGLPVNDEAAKAAVPATRHVVDVLCGFVATSPYMAGDAFTLADIHAGSHIDMLSECPEGAQMVKGTPLEAWLERIRVRPCMATTTWDALAQAQAA
jgi:glutathione S-transferase